MYAIVEIAGQQFKVEKDQQIFVNLLDGKEGDKVDFHDVLLVDNGGSIAVGAPAVEGAKVSAEIVRHLKGDKVIVFKKKRRKGYKKRNGHRQQFTEIKISGIAASGAKKPAAKKEAAPKAEAKTESAPKAEAPAKESGDLSSNTVAELKEMAKARGIANYTSMKKAELIEALGK